MWKQITPADIERAKAAWSAMREKILARHQEELRILEMDGNLLRNLETGLMIFHQRFMSPPQLSAVQTASLATPDAPITDQPDETATAIPSTSAPQADEAEPAGDERGPNFLQRARKWAGGETGSAADG